MVLSIVALGVFITALDQTVVVTALPSVMVDLKIPFARLDQVTWVVTAYLLGYTVAMPLIGRLADVYGYSLVYRVALVIFCIGSALVAVATSLEWMVAARVLQAVGGGATVPIGMAIAAGALPPHRRGWALGVVGAAAEAGSMLGPAYGGAIVEFWSWRGIFWLNLPQSAVVFLALGWLPARAGRASGQGNTGAKAKVDYVGGALLIATLTVLSLGLSQGSLFAISSPVPFAILLLGLGLAGVLVAVERRRKQPLLPPALFRSRAFIAANGAQLLVGVSLIIAMVTIPLMAGTVMGKTPIVGAFWLLRLTGAIPAGAIIGGLVLRRVGTRRVTVSGLCLVAVGLWLVSGWDLGVKDPELTWNLALAGFGFGLVIAPLMAKALESASEDYRSTAAALVVVSRMLG
ncbi:MAG: MFS transporter, partial [Chloroflexi bacterium]|nr:MFS transporter [Chloroflexota bacterium]